MARESGAGGRGAMRTTVMDRGELDIDVVLAAVDVPVLDAEVGEMDLVVEVGQFVFVSRAANRGLV